MCNNQKGRKHAGLDTHSHPFYDDYHGLMRFEANGGDEFDVLHGTDDVFGFEVVLKEADELRSPNAAKLSEDLNLGDRYAGVTGRKTALEILRKSVKYGRSGMKVLQDIAQASNVALEDAFIDMFGVAMDGSNINQCEFGKLKYDMLPASIKSTMPKEV